MEKKKVIIPYYDARPPKPRSGVIRIAPEAENVLIALQQERGLPISYIASQIILQNADNVEFVRCED